MVTTVDVKDAADVTRTINTLPALGGAAKAGSLPVATASDDVVLALLGAVGETAPASDTASSGHNGRLQRIAQRLTSVIALLPTAIGPQAKAASLAVTTATDDPVVALLGAVNETAPASDTASAGQNGRLQRIAQRLSSAIALLPTALGANGGLKIEGVASGTVVPISGTVTAAATESHLGQIGGEMATPSANFTRPADTTAYASGDLVANSGTAGSVVALDWSTATRVAAGSAAVRRARLKKSGTGVTSASFRLHLYSADPAASTGISNGDNAAWLTKIAGYLGAIDVTVDKVFSDGAAGNGSPNVGGEINFVLGSGQHLYGLLEARGAYTPANAEVFTVELEIYRN